MEIVIGKEQGSGAVSKEGSKLGKSVGCEGDSDGLIGNTVGVVGIVEGIIVGFEWI